MKKKICRPCEENCRCAKCKVPLNGFWYKYIAKPLFGIRPSSRKKGYCNKCE